MAKEDNINNTQQSETQWAPPADALAQGWNPPEDSKEVKKKEKSEYGENFSFGFGGPSKGFEKGVKTDSINSDPVTPPTIQRTSEDARIYESYSTKDFYGEDKLDVGALVDRYNEVVSKNIPENAEIRMPTKEEYDSLTGEGKAIDEMVVDTNRPIAPSSSFEYILGKGAGQSLLFKSLLFLTDAGNSYSDTPFKDAYDKMQYRSRDLAEYYNKYDPNMLEDATAFAFGMFLDTPLFGGAGQVGKHGYKSSVVGINNMSKRMALRGVEKEVADRAIINSTERLLASKGFRYGATAVSGGTALGTYGALGDLAYQIESGKEIDDIDWGHSLKEGGKSFILGSTLGLSSQAFGMLSYKTAGQIENVFNRRMVQAGFRTADFAAENAIFLYGSAALDPNVSMSDITWDDAYKLGVELAALKLSGALQANVKGIKKSPKFKDSKVNKEEFNVSFDDIEKRYIGKEGSSSESIIASIKADPAEFAKVLDNPDVPMNTKYKMLWAAEGKMPESVSLPTEVRSEKTDRGFKIETYDELGNKLESREIKNEKTALILMSQLEPQVRENQMKNKSAQLTTESKVAVDAEMKEEGIDESVLFAAINKNPLERTVEDKGIMDMFYQKIDKYAAKDIKAAEETRKKAEKTLEGETKPEYSIEGQKYDDIETFMKEVGKYAGKEESPKIEVKNDEKATKLVNEVLTNKKGVQDALQEAQQIKQEKILQEEQKQKGEEVTNAQELESGKMREEGKEAGKVEEVGDKDMSKLDRPVVQDGKEKQEKVSRTMAQADKMVNDIKAVIELEPEPGTEKAFRVQAENKVKKINEILNESKAQGHITSTQNRAIRTKIKNAVGGTDYQMRKAVEYAEKIVKDSEFRAKEEQKMNDISKIKKEVKGLFDKQSKYRRVKDIFNVKEAAEVVDEYSKLKEEDLFGMDAETVSGILKEIQDVKANLKESAKSKIEAKQKQKDQWVDRAMEVIRPVKKMKPEEVKYVEKDVKGRDVKIKYNPFKTFDTNLTSVFSRFAAKSTEPGKVGKDWLNRELYYGKMVPAERSYKKHLNESGDKLLKYIEKEYGKDARDVINDLAEDLIPITVSVKEGEKISQESRKVTREEAIKWYMLLQDPTLEARIFEPLSLNEKSSIYKGNGFTDKTVKEIESALTSKDKKLADFLFGEYQNARKRYNEFMKEKFGVNLPDNPKYSNIYSEYFENYDGLNVEDMMNGSPVGTLKSNNIISRVANKNTIKDVGAISSYLDYMDKMEWMYQFSEPLEMYRGIFKNKKVRRQIEVSHGKEALRLVDDYEKVMLRDLANISEKSIDKLTKNFANAALGLNPNITVKQLFSTVASMTEIRPDQFINEIKNLAIDAAKATTDKNNILRELASRESITMRGDVGLGMDVFLSPYARKNKLSSNKILSSVTKLTDKASKMYGKTIEFGDKGGAMIGGYTVYKTKYKEYKKKGLSDQQAKESALKDFDRFIDATQQSMSMFNTSMTRFKSGSLGRAVAAFTSAPAQLTRLEMNMWRNVYTGLTTKGQFSNKEVLKNIARIAVVRQLIPALYQYAADGWEWDPDNQLATLGLGNLQGVFLIGKGVEKLKNELMGSQFEVSAMPLVDNIQNLITNTIDMVDMYQFPSLYNDKEKKSILKRQADYLGLFIGQPVRSVRKIATADFKDFFDGVKSDQQEIAEEAMNKDIPLKALLVDRYGSNFVYDDDGKLRRSTRGYIEEYVYQRNKEMYGDFANKIRKVKDMRRNDDIKKYVVRHGRRMDQADFLQFMSYLSSENDFGDDRKIRFISEDMANEIKSLVLDAE